MKTIFINGQVVTISCVTFQKIAKIANREGLPMRDAVALLLKRLREADAIGVSKKK